MKHHLAALCALLSLTFQARAQWTTETYQLQPGWNAIYALNDCSYTPLDQLLAAYPPVTKVWRWVPTNLTAQFVGDPTQTVDGQEWKTWTRGDAINSTMTTLQPNHGYLVYVSGAAAVVLNLKGKAVLPQLEWRSSGANLVGFPAAAGATAPKFGGTTSGYLAPLAAAGYSPVTTQIFQYTGGEISGSNPSQVPGLTNATILRGKAFWVNLPVFTDFASPVKVELSSTGGGLHFGTRGGPQKVRVTNNSKAGITVTLTPTASETPPTGQPVPAGLLPLLQRVWNPAAQQYDFTTVAGPLTAALAAGASVEWVLTANRAAMTGATGSLYASVLKITDSGAHGTYSNLAVPVTAEKGSLAGLWVGEATITRVQNQLQHFLRDSSGRNITDADGHFVPDGPAEQGTTNTAQSFPLRLIIHVDAAGNARLFSTLYYGILDTSPGVTGFAVRQSQLKPAGLSTAVRLTATHLPLDVNAACTGVFQPGGVAAATVVLPWTNGVNPFLHTYHPDHDNLDARFNETPLPNGVESHTVTRALSLQLDAAVPAADPAWGTNTLTGNYSETLSGLHKNDIGVAGRFTLRRLSELATPPNN